ncbi:hypothetical protein HPB52_005383 [Rhipicephalus sanguineus]|uniref:Uncharacterized protein n=1 Tax=Rhipicephalus sanguineus TaxID=34632 RepID=A0A9D4PES3_RHISA|nr:hypothetical protein HPB52_005383 [Rhipicephalus sanguineus]
MFFSRGAQECVVTQGDDEGTDSPLSSSVPLFSKITPECVSGRPRDQDDTDQDSAPRQRNKLQLKPRSVPVEKKEEAAAVPKAPQRAPKYLSLIFGRARPVDTAGRKRKIEARLTRQREEERQQIHHQKPFQDRRKDDRGRRSSVAFWS